MLIEWEIRVSGDVGLNCRMVGKFKGNSLYCLSPMAVFI